MYWTVTRCSLILPMIFFVWLLLLFGKATLVLSACLLHQLSLKQPKRSESKQWNINKYIKENSRLIRPFVCMWIAVAMNEYAPHFFLSLSSISLSHALFSCSFFLAIRIICSKLKFSTVKLSFSFLSIFLALFICFLCGDRTWRCLWRTGTSALPQRSDFCN